MGFKSAFKGLSLDLRYFKYDSVQFGTEVTTLLQETLLLSSGWSSYTLKIWVTSFLGM